MVIGNEPSMALEDIKEVLKEEPNNFTGICTQVPRSEIILALRTSEAAAEVKRQDSH